MAFTDGLVELEAKGERYGVARLEKLLNNLDFASSKELIENIKADSSSFSSGNKQDDITLIAIKMI